MYARILGPTWYLLEKYFPDFLGMGSNALMHPVSCIYVWNGQILNFVVLENNGKCKLAMACT